MKKVLLFAVLVAMVPMVSGCLASVRTPITGILFTDVKGPESVGDGGDVSKSAEVCATSIMGWVAVGDASIEAAKKSGGISEIAFVDYHSTSVMGVFAKYCVRVSGR
ncbi:MAG: TRL-like family protein [Nitrospinota bacterium]|nr:TRL-like family protein [Nitrospinota bacterium]MDH5678007.1 TRL-like family protein [Nitrospinota bacterium]MDH5756009.1 TRL-like family protein [Nitrospinota bacterium]